MKIKAIIKTVLIFLVIIFPAENRSEVVINEILVNNFSTNLDPDFINFSSWIELKNKGSLAVEMSGKYLSDDFSNPYKWQFPAKTIIESQDFLIIFADDEDKREKALHTNFKLKQSGEMIGLFDTDGTVLDTLTFAQQYPNISYGRDEEANLLFYITPTPQTENTTTGITSPSFSAKINFSQPAGFYNGSQTIELTTESNQKSLEIRYTTDGSFPTKASKLYQNPITIEKTTTIKAVLFSENALPGKINTASYIFDRNIPTEKPLPVISLSLDSTFLWDYNSGIYIKGATYNASHWHSGNYFQDWERPASIEFFDKEGIRIFRQEVGIKMVGGGSRKYPQKSIAVHARSKYGSNKIEHQFFSNKKISEFSSIILRNSGQDWFKTMFADAMMQQLIKDRMDLDYLEYEPAALYLNGSYWGIHNIREKNNKDYLEANHNIDPDNIDMLGIENKPYLIEGDTTAYSSLIDYIENNNTALPEIYDYLNTQIDIDNFLNYNITEIYYANRDWPGNNNKFWREKNENGRWRWILYDTDYGFGLNSSYTTNALQYATEPNGPVYPNPPCATFLLRKLLENETFKNSFIQRFAAHINTTFEYERIISIIDRIKETIAEEMVRHIDRWGTVPYNGSGYGITSLEDWQDRIDNLKTFAQKRPDYMFQHLKDKFSLSTTSQLTLQKNMRSGGTVFVEKVKIPENSEKGIYFNELPLTIEAVAAPGYKFKNWSDLTRNIISKEQLLQISLQNDSTLIANFAIDTVITNIIINEINYKSISSGSDDWLELYNGGNFKTDISGWIMKDSNDDHNFTIPTNTIIEQDEYLVLCKDTTQFKENFPNIKNIYGNFDFGFHSEGEKIRLYDENNNLKDSVDYKNTSPWPVIADDSGSTLELISPEKDNSLAKSWKKSLKDGSPGEKNSVSDTTAVAVPQNFILYQNYPNPFNATTAIKFFVPQQSKVKLNIYNIKGQLVKALINKTYQTGNHKIIWKGDNNSGSQAGTGVFFYKLNIDGNDLKIKKCILLK